MSSIADTIKSTDSFWNDYFPNATFPFPGHPTQEFAQHMHYQYQLYREGRGSWYMIGNGNGQIWQRDSAGNWMRKDRTFFGGYNFNAATFGFMKFGGYGFWRTNGLLLFYVQKTGEWEAAQLSREIPGYGDYCYLDNYNGKLYLLGSLQMNTGLTHEYQFTDTLYSLDIRNRTWTTVGKMSSMADSLLSTKFWHKSFVWPKGLFMYADIIGKSVFVDLKAMKCIIPGDTGQLAFFKFYNGRVPSTFIMTTDVGLYKVDTAGYRVIDSLSWNELLQSPRMEFALLEAEAPGMNRLTPTGIAGLALLIGSGSIGYWWYRKRRIGGGPETSGADSIQPVPFNLPETPDFTLRRTDKVLFFNRQPLQELLGKQSMLIINTLIEKHVENSVMDTLQLNALLGIEDRSLDNQKKVRSESVKLINSVFRSLGFDGEAIQRVRQNYDRR
ncbi:MAG: hypothetical protein ACKOQY_07375, partial [Bacteroidota bacterium]